MSCTTSAQVATWISAAPVAPCRFICQRLSLCHAPLQRKSLHGSPQRQSLHVSSFVSACRSVMHHFSASRYMALHSANRFMSIQFIVSACRSCSSSLAVAPVASRTWSLYSSSRSIPPLTCLRLRLDGPGRPPPHQVLRRRREILRK